MVENKDEPSYELFAFGNKSESTVKKYSPRFRGEASNHPAWVYMTPSQQRKAIRDANRSKVTYDMPKELINQISGLAEDQRVPASQLAALLNQKGLREFEDGVFDLDCYKIPTRSPRFEWVLVLDPLEK